MAIQDGLLQEGILKQYSKIYPFSNHYTKRIPRIVNMVVKKATFKSKIFETRR